MSLPFKLSGKTADDKLQHVETILRRVLRRAPVKATVVIPPTPFCIYINDVPESGFLGRWVVPTTGKITALHLFVGFVEEKKKPTLTMTVKGKGVGSIIEINYKEGAQELSLNVDVTSGMLIELITNEPISVREISLGMLFEPEIAKAKKHAIVLDEVLATEEESTDAGTTTG